MELDQVKAEHARLGPWAHLATVTPDGEPHVVPVTPSWEGDTLWFMCWLHSVKVRNIRHQPEVMLHWQVGDETDLDSLIVWGSTEVHDSVETKRRLWTGVFDQDLSALVPGGPETPGVGFVAVTPKRALLLRTYGSRGREEWRAET